MTEDDTNIIGKPIKNVHVYILNSYGDMLPAGLYGEICLSGVGLAAGYLNNENGGKASFTLNKWEGQGMYRTGDIGRWTESGTIEFYGREDEQVKIRGHRVETKGIEIFLESLPNVNRAVVEGVDFSGEIRLVAYLETKEKNLDISVIKEKIKSNMPEYAVPSYIYWMEKLPTLSNGKIDRHSLANGTKLQDNKENERELSEIESAVTEIWKSILNLERIGLSDNFFDIGGNSITLMRMQSEIEIKFDVQIPVGELFQYTTILSLANYLEQKAKEIHSEITKYKYITLSDDYYLTSKKEQIVVEYLNEEIRERFEKIHESENIGLNDILCGLYCYLLSEACKQSEMTYYMVQRNLNECYSINADFSSMEDFEVLFKLVQQSYSSKCFSDSFINDLSYVKREIKGVIPVIVLQCSKLTEILRGKENVLAFSIEADDKVKITLSFTPSNGRYVDLKTIMEMYLDLLNQFTEKV